MENVEQIAADAYLAVHKMVITACEATNNTDKELALEGENLMETFQGYIEVLQDKSLV